LHAQKLHPNEINALQFEGRQILQFKEVPLSCSKNSHTTLRDVTPSPDQLRTKKNRGASNKESIIGR
jgi:hypothetical protein